MKFGVGVLYKQLSRKREFRENRLSDCHCLRKVVNEFLTILAKFTDRFG